MYRETKRWRWTVRLALLVALAASLAGCIDLSGQEATSVFDSPLVTPTAEPGVIVIAPEEDETGAFDSPLATPTAEATPYIHATLTTLPFPTPLPTPVVTAFPTAQPPIIPLLSEPAAKPFTIVFPDGNVIRAINSDGTDERALIDILDRSSLFLASDNEQVKVNGMDCGSISPDGKRLALVLSNVESWESLPKGERAEFSIHLFDLATGDLKLLVQDGVEPVWSPDGARIAYRSTKTSGLWIMDVSTGETREIYNVDRENEHFVTNIDWSPDGKRLVFLDKVFRQSVAIIVIKAGGTEPARVLVSPSTHWPSFPKWSPDGNRIMFISPAGKSSGPLNDYNLWVMNPDGTGQIQLTQDINVSAGLPRWSFDGHWISFAGTLGYEEPEPLTDLWLVDRAGSELKRLTSNAVNATNEGMPTWSPDGARIIFDRDRKEVWMISLADGVQTKLFSITADFFVVR